MAISGKCQKLPLTFLIKMYPDKRYCCSARTYCKSNWNVENRRANRLEPPQFYKALSENSKPQFDTILKVPGTDKKTSRITYTSIRHKQFEHTMTGGIGFSRQGQDSFRKNRELLKKRGSMKDNPYSATNKTNRLDAANYEELIDYKRTKSKKEFKRTIVIWALIFLTVFLSILILILTH